MESRTFSSIIVAALFMVGTAVVAAGYLDRSVGSLESNNTNIYMGFEAGYVLHPRVLVGLEPSGWVRQWVNGPAGKSTLDGWGATMGIGYDDSWGENRAVTPFVN